MSDDLVEVGGRIFVKATATATKDDEVRCATRFSELDTVPILNTKDYKTGELKQVQQMQGFCRILSRYRLFWHIKTNKNKWKSNVGRWR